MIIDICDAGDEAEVYPSLEGGVSAQFGDIAIIVSYDQWLSLFDAGAKFMGARVTPEDEEWACGPDWLDVFSGLNGSTG